MVLDTRNEALILRLSRLMGRALVPYHRAEVRGLDRIVDGAALYVGNHNGGLLSIDTFLFGHALIQERGLEDVPFGLAHDRVMDWPGFRHALGAIGAVRANHENARALFESGKKVLVYPGGDIDSLRPYSERHRVKFGGRSGFAKLALRHQVPIQPVVAAGAHGTFIVIRDLPWLAKRLDVKRRLRITPWPLVFSIPWGFTFGPPPPYIPLPTKIIVEVLEPMGLPPGGSALADDPSRVKAYAEQVEEKLQEALTRLAPEVSGAST